MPISKAELVQMIKAIPNWQKMNKREIADIVIMDRCYITRVMKEFNLVCDHARRKQTTPIKTNRDWTQYKKPKEERRGVLKSKCDQLDKALAKATDYRCDKCALLKRQCWECYSLEVAGRLPIEPCIHQLEPRGVYV